MKKAFAAILALIYFATSMGAAVNMHYCMGKLYAVDLMSAVKCNHCGMEKSDGCCKDEVKVLKVKDIHQQATADVKFNAPVAVLNSHQVSYNSLVHVVAPSIATCTHSPPLSSTRSLCILNCVFRI